MTQSWNNARFKKSCLASLIAVLLSPSVYALESLSDDSLAETTGEGVALTLENFKMVFQGPQDVSRGSSYARGVANPGQADTGFIRIIPTGENYQQLSDRAFNDVYQPAYNAQYQISYNSVYSSSKSTEFNRIQAGERTISNTELNTATRRTEYTNFEKTFVDGTVAQERYNNYMNSKYNGILYLTWSAERKQNAARADATTDVNSNQTYINQISTKVTNRITSEVNALGDSRANQKADVFALAAVTTHANKQIRTNVNSTDIPNIMVNKRTKADVFIYGLALSKSDGSLNTRFSNQGFAWGTADNPWLVHAGTEKSVKQFSDTAKDIGYIAIEAPLMPVTATADDNNIKLGFWTDIFARGFESSKLIDPVTGAPTEGLDINQRLRLQVVANGLSLHGSQVRLFQTLEDKGADGKPTNYSQTLGMASIVRINTHDNPENLSKTDSLLNSRGIRISTAAKDNSSDGTAATPALTNSGAPIFNEHEGLYIYSPNINLVLGNMYQPFIVGSEGNNIILEVTRIPNIHSIYNEIYQNYGGGLGTSDLKGSTCNVYQCGTPIKNHSTDQLAAYQGKTATHSSIAIGTVERIPGTNRLRAKDDINATGIMFKDASGVSKNFGSAVIDGVLIQHLKIKTTGL